VASVQSIAAGAEGERPPGLDERVAALETRMARLQWDWGSRLARVEGRLAGLEQGWEGRFGGLHGWLEGLERRTSMCAASKRDAAGLTPLAARVAVVAGAIAVVAREGSPCGVSFPYWCWP
jgi:hypothetical protein